jgi:hypothetical protein
LFVDPSQLKFGSSLQGLLPAQQGSSRSPQLSVQVFGFGVRSHPTPELHIVLEQQGWPLAPQDTQLLEIGGGAVSVLQARELGGLQYGEAEQQG